MSKFDILILIFGFLVVLSYLKNNREQFESTDPLHFRLDDFGLDYNYGMGSALDDDKDLAHVMESILGEEDKNIKQGRNEFGKNNLSSMYTPNYVKPINENEEDYLVNAPMPTDISRHDYKLENNPNDIIDEMTKNGEPIELRKVYNNTVKDFKESNPKELKIINSDVGQSQYAYINKEQEKSVTENTNKIRPLESVNVMFSYE